MIFHTKKWQAAMEYFVALRSGTFAEALALRCDEGRTRTVSMTGFGGLFRRENGPVFLDLEEWFSKRTRECPEANGVFGEWRSADVASRLCKWTYRAFGGRVSAEKVREFRDLAFDAARRQFMAISVESPG
ncbi:MAG: hypothetical protein L0211_16525 [Planctomycetaceae bacterium]|nr:hypothetical protein [Planctomycetaceae bacterium]